MLILIFILLHSTKKKQKKINQFIEKQEAKIEATRKLNDVVSEVKKITEADHKKEANEEDDSTLKIEEVKLEKDLEENNQDTEIKKSKKELKKEAKRRAKEEKKQKKHDFLQEEITSGDEKVEDGIKTREDYLSDDTEEFYDIFEDDRKKKKKK